MPDAKTTKKTQSTPPPAKPSQPAPPAPPSPDPIAVAGQAQQTLDMLNQRLTDIESRVASSATAFLTLAQSKPIQTLAQSSPQLKAQLPTLVSSLQTVVTTTQASQSARTQVLSAVRTTLQLPKSS